MTRRILGVLFAVILAIVGTALVLVYVASVRSSVASGQQAVHVLIAKARIPAGTSASRIRANNLAVDMVMPKSSLPTGYLSDLPVDLDKLVLTSDMQANQLLLRGSFGDPGKYSGGLDIPDGMMAVSFAVREPADVAQYVRPGSQVAIFVYAQLVDPTAKTTDTTNQNHLTEVLLPKVTVLAIGAYGANGQTASQAQDQQPLNNSSSTTSNNTLHQTTTQIEVTVAVNQVDATRLVHSAEGYELYLALLTDTAQVQAGQGVTDRTVG
jgi:pilus assembly protein CpaB